MEIKRDKVIMINTEDFVEMIKDEERIEILNRLLDSEKLVTESTLKAVLGYKEPVKGESEIELII